MHRPKQKFSLWLPEEEAAKFLIIFRRAKSRDGRTNYSEVIRELMGFPCKEGIKPVTTAEDRESLSKDIDEFLNGKIQASKNPISGP